MSIVVSDLSFTYAPKTSFAKVAIQNVSFEITEGETVGIIGSTGSGKSTLIQHLNGLIRITSGSVKVYDIDLTAKRPDLKRLRRSVGMLFQYPEYQLFADTVLQDVCFGPLNFGATLSDAKIAAEESIRLVGLDFDEVKNRSPFELSGGQRRRAAIAGVLACRPKILVLDEPTAGLDPAGKREMLNLIAQIKGNYIKTVIMISHNMDEIAEYTQRVLVMNNGRLIRDCTPVELFADSSAFTDTGLEPPHCVKISNMLRERGIETGTPLTTTELANAIINAKEGLK
ncbi:MAG: energy-coupling factor transporter ATPase [Christensenellaceae bacterium]|jgi:energy-coupling factor transport system ATP-binding protein|nr:energy-coupling factor transporter ATPase [Christensenellaceae bacterium]